jgi:hypothetical protein
VDDWVNIAYVGMQVGRAAGAANELFLGHQRLLHALPH